MILISHDRDFLDRVVTSVIVPEAMAAGSNMPAATPTCWRSAARISRARPPVQPSRKSRATKTAAPAAASKRRLNFNEKHALETLPKTMKKLQAEIAKQQKLLDDPDLYAKDRKKFDAASAAIAKAQEELAAAEDRWLELEVLREEIEQA